MSDSNNNNNKDKVSFGAVKETNKNWVDLVSEISAWRNDNRSTKWPDPQVYAKTINPHWQKFASSEFCYRYHKAKEMIDEKLKISPGKFISNFYFI